MATLNDTNIYGNFNVTPNLDDNLAPRLSITFGSADEPVNFTVNGIPVPETDNVKAVTITYLPDANGVVNIPMQSSSGCPDLTSYALKSEIPDISGLELTANKTTTIDSNSTDTEYPTAKAVHDALTNLTPPDLTDYALKSELPDLTNYAEKSEIPDITGLESTSNKVTSITSESTDEEYPSAKAVHDAIEAIEPVDLTDYATKDWVTSQGFCTDCSGGGESTSTLTELGKTYTPVDLGLSVLWADKDLSVSGNEERFAWGELTSRALDSEGESFKADYRWYNESDTNTYLKYNTSDTLASLQLEDDAAHVLLGGGWRLPTLEELNELATLLYDDLNRLCTFYSSSDPSSLIQIDFSHGSSMTTGLWSSTLRITGNKPYTTAHVLYEANGSVSASNTYRYRLIFIRPVWDPAIEPLPTTPDTHDYAEKSDIGEATVTIKVNGTTLGTFTVNDKEDSVINLSIPTGSEKVYAIPETVDMGLPSGTLWANFNIGATKPEELGGLFAFNEPFEKRFYTANNYHYYSEAFTTQYNYIYFGIGENNTYPCVIEDDPAYVNLGHEWVVPTKDDWYELLDNTSSEFAEINGIGCVILTSTINNSQLTIPLALIETHYLDPDSLLDQTFNVYTDNGVVEGLYWTRSTADGTGGLYVNTRANGVYFEVISPTTSSPNINSGVSSAATRWYGRFVRPVKIEKASSTEPVSCSITLNALPAGSGATGYDSTLLDSFASALFNPNNDTNAFIPTVTGVDLISTGTSTVNVRAIIYIDCSNGNYGTTPKYMGTANYTAPNGSVWEILWNGAGSAYVAVFDGHTDILTDI